MEQDHPITQILKSTRQGTNGEAEVFIVVLCPCLASINQNLSAQQDPAQGFKMERIPIDEHFGEILKPLYLVLLLPPLSTLLLGHVIDHSVWDTYVFLLHFLTASFVTWVVLIVSATTSRGHKLRSDLQAALVPRLWAFILFIPFFVIVDAAPTPVWEGISLASGGVINLIVHRTVIRPVNWGTLTLFFLLTAGVGSFVVALRSGVVGITPGLLETMLLYGLYGGVSSSVLYGWDRHKSQLPQTSG